jgi:hypothetical protein
MAGEFVIRVLGYFPYIIKVGNSFNYKGLFSLVKRQSVYEMFFYFSLFPVIKLQFQNSDFQRVKKFEKR